MQLSKSSQDVGLATLMLVLVFAMIAPATGQEANQNAGSQQPANSVSQQVPSVDGGLGPCSVEITVKRPGGKVVDGAKVAVHIAYGFLNVRRLDLEVPTNMDGKARITGLPNNLKHGLLLHGSKDNLLGTAFVDPAKTCEAKHELVLVQQAPPEQDNSAADQKDTENKDT